MSIIHAQTTVLVSGARIIYVVALGSTRSKLGFAIGTEASAGFRFKFNGGSDGPSQLAQSPDNVIVEGDWGQDRTIITPPGFNADFFEFKWEETSKDAGFTSTTSPAAISTFAVWNGNEQWIARRVGSIGTISWEIVVTLRQISDITKTSSHTVILSVQVDP